MDESVKKHLDTMAENIQDILTSVQSIHGEDYHTLLICLFGGAAAVTQVANLAEDAIKFITVDSNVDEPNRQLAIANLPLVLINMGNYMNSLTHICDILEHKHGMKDIGKNLNALMDRVETDFMAKIDRSPI